MTAAAVREGGLPEAPAAGFNRRMMRMMRVMRVMRAARALRTMW
jgi:hypothetical protein